MAAADGNGRHLTHQASGLFGADLQLVGDIFASQKRSALAGRVSTTTSPQSKQKVDFNRR